MDKEELMKALEGIFGMDVDLDSKKEEEKDNTSKALYADNKKSHLLLLIQDQLREMVKDIENTLSEGLVDHALDGVKNHLEGAFEELIDVLSDGNKRN